MPLGRAAARSDGWEEEVELAETLRSVVKPAVFYAQDSISLREVCLKSYDGSSRRAAAKRAAAHEGCSEESAGQGPHLHEQDFGRTIRDTENGSVGQMWLPSGSTLIGPLLAPTPYLSPGVEVGRGPVSRVSSCCRGIEVSRPVEACRGLCRGLSRPVSRPVEACVEACRGLCRGLSRPVSRPVEACVEACRGEAC